MGIKVVPTKIDDHGASEEKGMQEPLKGEIGIRCLPPKASKDDRLKTKNIKHASEVGVMRRIKNLRIEDGPTIKSLTKRGGSLRKD